MAKMTFFLACMLNFGPALSLAADGTALPFLKIDAGARAAALGGAYAAAGDDALSVFYNPAGAALLDRKDLEFTHNQWLEGLRNESLAYAHPLDGSLTVFGGVNALLSGAMDRYDAASNPTGVFSSQEGAFSLGLAAELDWGFYGAAALKNLYQKADKAGAMAWAGDAGLLKISGKTRLGISVSNLGTGMKLGARSFDLPVILRAGAARRLSGRFMLSADAVKAGETPAALCAGMEANFETGIENSAFFARAGYKSGRSRYAGSGITFGIGVKSRDLRLDYAFAPYGDLGDAHRVTFSLLFGEERD